MVISPILAEQDIVITKVNPTTTLVVFDSRVSDIETLSQALLPGAVGVTIDAEANGLVEITQLLAATGAKYLAVVAHGEPGIVHLGKSPLNIEQLQSQSQLLSGWGVQEIALYSCEVAQGDIGKDLIYQLSELTGATVAAAATKTGSAALGGSWDLAVTTGKIAAPELFQASILQAYQSVLVVRLGDRTTIPAGTNVSSVRLGDVNGDGKLDIITANRGSNNVSVLLGDGLGGFSAASNYAVGTSPVSAQVGDFNGDGKLDIITANDGSNNVSLLLNNGSGGFNPAINYAVGTTPFSPRIGDFNGDGKLDVVTANNGSNNVSVLLNNGTGGFSAATSFTVGSNPYGTVLGDFNGDSKLDIITAGAGTSSLLLSVLLGDGAGGFSAAANVAVDSSPRQIRSGDFNADGKLDLAVTEVSDKISVLLGNGTGGFGIATKFATASIPNRYGFTAVPQNLVVGDFNGDSKLDLLSGTRQQNFPGPGARGVEDESLFLGDGAGGFSPAVSTADSTDPFQDIVLGSASEIIAGDINGDGKLDVVAANGSDNSVSVLFNVLTNRNDFNGDGKGDILWRNDYGNVALWQMNGATVTSGKLAATNEGDGLTIPVNLDPSWKAAGTGDFSGDGKADILWRNTDGAIAVWTMDGSIVKSSDLTSTPSLDNSWKTAGTGDYNGDGKSDILWRNDNGSVAVWTMNGATVTASALTSTPSLDSSWKVAGNSDFDGDGKADILWRNDDGSVALWQMNGAAITASTAISKVSTDWKIAGTGDFNNDNKADILWRNDDGRVALWQMNGAAITSSNLTSTPSRDSSQTIAGISDYNRDGKSDILWRKDTGALEVWQMNGATVVSSTLTSVTADGSFWKIAAPII